MVLAVVMMRRKTTFGLPANIKRFFATIIRPLKDIALFLFLTSRLQNDDFYFW